MRYPANAKQIMASTGINPTTVSSTLCRLNGHNVISKAGKKGQYIYHIASTDKADEIMAGTFIPEHQFVDNTPVFDLVLARQFIARSNLHG